MGMYCSRLTAADGIRALCLCVRAGLSMLCVGHTLSGAYWTALAC